MTTTSAIVGPVEVFVNAMDGPIDLQPTSSPPRYTLQTDDAYPTAANHRRTLTSGKIMERLAAENDRLRRELKAERAAKEEAEETARVQRTLIESLQSNQSNLEHVHGSDVQVAEKKDRRIAQLKEALEAEVTRRLFAEDKAKEMADKLGDAGAEARRQVSEAQSMAKREEVAHSTVRASYDELSTDIASLRVKMAEIEAANKGLDRTVQRLTILGAERDKYQAAASKTNAALRKRLDQYQARELRMAALEEEMESAVRAMRWVVKLHGKQEVEGVAA